jgi:hypothetical protein
VAGRVGEGAALVMSGRWAGPEGKGAGGAGEDVGQAADRGRRSQS